MPELLDDIDQSLISFAIEAFGCEPSATNMWVGEHHSVTTTHADPFENLYVVISGTKTFRLRPPSDSAFLSKPSLPRARWTYTHGGACDASDQDAVLQPEKEYAGWELRREEGETEWIDESCINEKCGDDVVVELHAGDMLYLPALWYHHVSQRGITIAVNWWFEMTFGRDWVYRELCSNLRPQARNGPVQAVEGNASSGEF